MSDSKKALAKAHAEFDETTARAKELATKIREKEEEIAELNRQNEREGLQLTEAADRCSVRRNAEAATDQIPAPTDEKYTTKLPLDVLKDVASTLDRFSLDRAGFAWPKFRAAVVAMPDGQCLRKLEAVRLRIQMRASYDEWNDGNVGDRTPFSISMHGWEDPMTLRNGATQTAISQSWGFADIASATSHFIGLLRSASVREVSTDGPLPSHFLQALSAADMLTDVGSLDIRQSAFDAGHLPAGRGAVTAFRRLGVLDIQREVPLDFLTDEFLVAMAARRTTHVRVAAQINVPLGRSGGWGDHRHNDCLAHDVHAKLRSVDNCPYLSTGLTAFMFRDYGYPFDDGIAHEEGQNGPHPSSNVELFFGAARVPSGICQTIMEAAVSSKSNYSIYVSFVAVSDVDIHLERFEARKRHDGCAWYKVPSLHDANVMNELFVTAVELVPNEYGFYGFNAFGNDKRGARNGWTCVVFRRYRESDRRYSKSASVWGPS